MQVKPELLHNKKQEQREIEDNTMDAIGCKLEPYTNRAENK